MSYDYLIVAAGSSSSYFGHDDWKANAPSLKTLDDALQIRGRMLLAYELAEREDNPELRKMLLTFVHRRRRADRRRDGRGDRGDRAPDAVG